MAVSFYLFLKEVNFLDKSKIISKLWGKSKTDTIANLVEKVEQQDELINQLVNNDLALKQEMDELKKKNNPTYYG